MGLFRFLLAMSVFMDHANGQRWYGGFGGSVSVEIFFFISGFYIASILDLGYKSKRNFYFSRFLRIYPILLIVSIAVLMRAFLVSDFRSEIFQFPSRYILYSLLPNLTLIGSDWIMFLRQTSNGLDIISQNTITYPLYHLLWIPPAWSLGIEITFYVLAPLIVRRATKTVLSLAIILILLRFFGYYMGLNFDPWTYRFFPFELPLFLLGIITYRLSKNYSYKIKHKYIYIVLIVSYLLIGILDEYFGLSRVLILVCGLLLAGAILSGKQKNNFDQKLGELSYPIYVTHLFLITSYGFLVFPNSMNEVLLRIMLNQEFRITFSFAACILFSYLLLKLLSPIERHRDRLRDAPKN